MTAAELKRAAAECRQRIIEGEKTAWRAIMAERELVMAILRAVAGGTLGYYDRTSESVELASDEDTDGDRLVIGGGNE